MVNQSRITDKEIEECGWTPEVIRIDKDILDDQYTHNITIIEDGDVLIDGWSLTINDKEWYDMCRNSRRLVIIHKWYQNEVGQEWDVVMDVPIVDKQDLLNEMSYLEITKKINNEE